MKRWRAGPRPGVPARPGAGGRRLIHGPCRRAAGPAPVAGRQLGAGTGLRWWGGSTTDRDGGDGQDAEQQERLAGGQPLRAHAHTHTQHTHTTHTHTHTTRARAHAHKRTTRAGVPARRSRCSMRAWGRGGPGRGESRLGALRKGGGCGCGRRVGVGDISGTEVGDISGAGVGDISGAGVGDISGVGAGDTRSVGRGEAGT